MNWTRWMRHPSQILKAGTCPYCQHPFNTTQAGWQNHLNDCGVPLVCLCLTPDPQPCGQCATCLRVIVERMNPTHRAAALRAYPELERQTSLEAIAAWQRYKAIRYVKSWPRWRARTERRNALRRLSQSAGQ